MGTILYSCVGVIVFVVLNCLGIYDAVTTGRKMCAYEGIEYSMLFGMFWLPIAIFIAFYFCFVYPIRLTGMYIDRWISKRTCTSFQSHHTTIIESDDENTDSLDSEYAI